MIACLQVTVCVCVCEQDTETEKNLVFDLLSQPKGFNCTPGAAGNLRAGEAHTV